MKKYITHSRLRHCTLSVQSLNVELKLNKNMKTLKNAIYLFAMLCLSLFFPRSSYGQSVTNVQLTQGTNNITTRGTINNLIPPTTGGKSTFCIIIDSGVFAKIVNRKIYMKLGGYIQVKKGGWLYIDSSVITNYLDSNGAVTTNTDITKTTWQTIDVEGQPGAPACNPVQLGYADVATWYATYDAYRTASPAIGQGIGYLLVAHSTLKHARNAIRAWDNAYLHVTYDTFLNNFSRDIQFSFNNLPVGSNCNYWRNIIHSHFELSNKYLGIQKSVYDTNTNWNTPPIGNNTHAKMFIQVDQMNTGYIHIWNCTFKSSATRFVNWQVKDNRTYTYGIYSVSSKVQVSGCRFEKLFRGYLGVDPYNSANTSGLYDYDNDYIFCDRAVVSNGQDYIEASGNYFDLDRSPVNQGAYGYQLNGVANYSIYNNLFNRANAISGEQNSDVAVCLQSTGIASGLVACNHADHLSNGIISANDNRTVDIHRNIIKNTYVQDMRILYNGGTLANAGVGKWLGSINPAYTTANRFDYYDHVTGSNNQIYRSKHIVQDSSIATLNYVYRTPSADYKPLYNLGYVSALIKQGADSGFCESVAPGPAGYNYGHATGKHRTLTDLESGGFTDSSEGDYVQGYKALTREMQYLLRAWQDSFAHHPENHSYEDSIRLLVNNVPTFGNKYALLRFFINHNLKDSVAAMLTQWETDSSSNEDLMALCGYYRFVLQAMDQNYDTAWMREHVHELDGIAWSRTLAAGKAKGMIIYFTMREDSDEVYMDLMQDSMLNFAIDESEIDTNLSNPSVGLTLSCVPVPFDATLTMTVTNTSSLPRTVTIYLNDFWGHPYYNHTTTLGLGGSWNYAYASSALDPGYYIVSVVEAGQLKLAKLVVK
jgi:hypothetical protein